MSLFSLVAPLFPAFQGQSLDPFFSFMLVTQLMSSFQDKFWKENCWFTCLLPQFLWLLGLYNYLLNLQNRDPSTTAVRSESWVQSICKHSFLYHISTPVPTLAPAHLNIEVSIESGLNIPLSASRDPLLIWSWSCFPNLISLYLYSNLWTSYLLTVARKSYLSLPLFMLSFCCCFHLLLCCFCFPSTLSPTS